MDSRLLMRVMTVVIVVGLLFLGRTFYPLTGSDSLKSEPTLKVSPAVSFAGTVTFFVKDLNPPEDICMGYLVDGEDGPTRISCFQARSRTLQQSYVVREAGTYSGFVRTHDRLVTAPFTILDRASALKASQ